MDFFGHQDIFLKGKNGYVWHASDEVFKSSEIFWHRDRKTGTYLTFAGYFWYIFINSTELPREKFNEDSKYVNYIGKSFRCSETNPYE